jgi:hypothetical protein
MPAAFRVALIRGDGAERFPPNGDAWTIAEGQEAAAAVQRWASPAAHI